MRSHKTLAIIITTLILSLSSILNANFLHSAYGKLGCGPLPYESCINLPQQYYGISLPSITTEIGPRFVCFGKLGCQTTSGTVDHAYLEYTSPNAGGIVTYTFFTTPDCIGAGTSQAVKVFNGIVPASRPVNPPPSSWRQFIVGIGIIQE